MEENTMDDHPKKTTDAATDDLDDKLKEARLAMEGTEHAAKREAREKTEAVHSERESIKERLAGISKEKEELELAWITLDEKRASVRQTLMPLIEEEKKDRSAGGGAGGKGAHQRRCRGAAEDRKGTLRNAKEAPRGGGEKMGN